DLTFVESVNAASAWSASPEPVSSAEQLIETLAACQPGSIVWQLTAGGVVSGAGSPGASRRGCARDSVESWRLGRPGTGTTASVATTRGDGSTRTIVWRGSRLRVWSSEARTTPGGTGLAAGLWPEPGMAPPGNGGDAGASSPGITSGRTGTSATPGALLPPST